MNAQKSRGKVRGVVSGHGQVAAAAVAWRSCRRAALNQMPATTTTVAAAVVFSLFAIYINARPTFRLVCCRWRP